MTCARALPNWPAICSILVGRVNSGPCSPASCNSGAATRCRTSFSARPSTVCTSRRSRLRERADHLPHTSGCSCRSSAKGSGPSVNSTLSSAASAYAGYGSHRRAAVRAASRPVAEPRARALVPRSRRSDTRAHCRGLRRTALSRARPVRRAARRAGTGGGCRGGKSPQWPLRAALGRTALRAAAPSLQRSVGLNTLSPLLS